MDPRARKGYGRKKQKQKQKKKKKDIYLSYTEV